MYLLWLCMSHFFLQSANDDDAASEESPGPAEAAAKSLAATAFTIALTDLAFSLDSVAGAVAQSGVDNLTLEGVMADDGVLGADADTDIERTGVAVAWCAGVGWATAAGAAKSLSP